MDCFLRWFKVLPVSLVLLSRFNDWLYDNARHEWWDPFARVQPDSPLFLFESAMSGIAVALAWLNFQSLSCSPSFVHGTPWEEAFCFRVSAYTNPERQINIIVIKTYYIRRIIWIQLLSIVLWYCFCFKNTEYRESRRGIWYHVQVSELVFWDILGLAMLESLLSGSMLCSLRGPQITVWPGGWGFPNQWKVGLT